jgi:hypothetical protein
MPYNRQIPDAPIAGSMLPRATDLTLDDILVLIQPGNPIGQKNKALALSVLANWLANGNMGPFKTSEINVGTSIWKNVPNVGPTIEHLYYLGAGIIEAAMKFKVGGSEWVPGNNQPFISGLYSLEAGNVDSANVAVDTLKPHSSGGTKIEVAAMLVKSLSQANEKLSLGPTQMNGDSRVVGKLQVDSLVTSRLSCGEIAIEVTDSTSVSSAEAAVASMENGRMFIIVNTSTSAQEFHFSGGAVVSITSKHGLWGIKRAGYSYPIDT